MMKKQLILIIMATIGFGGPAFSKALETASIQKAETLIPIKITGLEGNVVKFIIPENAREHDERGNAVKVSGLYDVAQGKNGTCPYMLSSDIHKNVKSYNPFGGRAVVDATFSTEDQAQAAYESKCIVIENVE